MSESKKVLEINDKAVMDIISFAMNRFNQNSKYSAGDHRESQIRLVCAGLHDYLCSKGIVPNFRVSLPEDIEHGSLEDIG